MWQRYTKHTTLATNFNSSFNWLIEHTEASFLTPQTKISISIKLTEDFFFLKSNNSYTNEANSQWVRGYSPKHFVLFARIPLRRQNTFLSASRRAETAPTSPNLFSWARAELLQPPVTEVRWSHLQRAPDAYTQRSLGPRAPAAMLEKESSGLSATSLTLGGGLHLLNMRCSHHTRQKVRSRPTELNDSVG